MKIFLLAVNARYSHSNPAIYILKKVLEQKGRQIITAEWSINNERELILAQIYREKPDLIGFSAYIWNISYLEILADEIRRLLPDTLLIFGGPQASGEKQALLERVPAIDGLVIGEGEEAFVEVINTLDAGKSRRYLPGVLWQGEESYEEAPHVNLGGLPFPYSKEELESLAGKIIYYESSRGCPYGCIFCFSAHEPLRERPIALVKEDLAYLAANFQGQFKLVDRTFNADKERAKEISSYLLELYSPSSSWHLEISPYNLPRELLDIWQEAPPDYLRLEAGVQSLNEDALRAIGRHSNWQNAREALISIMKKDNLRLHLDLLAGLPGETMESFTHAFNEVHDIMPHYLQLGFLKVLPGSILAQKAEGLGIVYSKYPPYRVLSTPDLAPEKLFILQSVEDALSDYYNSGRFRQTLALSAKYWPGGAMAFYLALAEAREKAIDSPMSLKEKAEILWRVLSALPQRNLFFDALRLDWYLYGKGEPMPGIFRTGKEQNNGKGFILALEHQIDFEDGARIAFSPGPATYSIDQNQRLGVSRRAFCCKI